MRKSVPSQTALAAADLQRAIKGARVVYLSATGATEPHNLAYTDRLGLWGPNTAFGDKNDFINACEAGGLAMMELIARDMKSLGLYTSRNLCFRGVEYTRLDHILTPDQREVYDTLARAWQVILQNIRQALETVASRPNKDGDMVVDTKAKSAALSAFWGAHQRFFNQIITAMQMPSVIVDIEKRIAEGHCAVLQLVNTNEAAQERQLAKLDEEDDLSDIDLTPRDQIVQLLEHAFPVVQQETYEDPHGNIRMREVVDSNGQRVFNAEAVAMRDRLIAQVASIRVPDGPLEMVINHFGPDKVAEVTGRKRRVVRLKIDGSEKTVQQKRSPRICMADIAAFLEDRKSILIFSNAGGTGRSYHSSPKFKNQRRRYHYLVQPGWVAEDAIQGFGRTHRSDEVNQPMYVLVQTDLKGQKRFISTIARRLDSLGALTKGQRQAASNGIFTAACPARSGDNLESSHAKDALRRFFVDLHAQRVPEISIGQFCRETGLELVDQNGRLREETPIITQFLNRLLSLTIDTQNIVFEAFDKRHLAVIQQAADNGTLDLGIEAITADAIVKLSERVVWTDKATAAQTKLVTLSLSHKTEPRSFDDLMEGRWATGFKKVSFFARNKQSGRIYAFAPGNDRTDATTGTTTATYREIGILSDKPIPIAELRENKNWQRINDFQTARQFWDTDFADAPRVKIEKLHLITGAILPIWDRLPRDWPKVMRLQTDPTPDFPSGERMLGRVVPTEQLEATMKRLGMEGFHQKFTIDQIIALLDKAQYGFTLSNGWKLKPSRVSGEVRFEIVGPRFNEYESQLQPIGCFTERIQSAQRFFVPTGNMAPTVISRLIDGRPVVSLARAERSVPSARPGPAAHSRYN